MVDRQDLTPRKSGFERVLATVRARVTNALDLLQDNVARETSPGGRRAREELEQAEKVLRSAELQHGGGGYPSSSPPSGQSPGSTSNQFGWCGLGCSDKDLDLNECTLGPSGSGSSSVVTARYPRDEQHYERVREVSADPEVARILERCGHFDFDALALAATPQAGGMVLSVLGSHLLRKHRLVWQLEEQGCLKGSVAFEQALVSFFAKMDGLYKSDVIYHNAAHAADVTATTEWLMQSQYMKARTTQLDHFMSLVASLIHDVGHPGRNNLFHTKTMSPLAVRYNDKAILEQMHVSLAFETMQSSPESDWFNKLARVVPAKAFEATSLAPAGAADFQLQQYTRRGLIAMVLATDMAKHGTHVQELKGLAQEPETADTQKALERKLFLLETVVHAADISNPCKPRDVMMSWTRRVLQEFWRQGDEEVRLGLEVSPLCDRADGCMTVPEGQIGFISFVVQPFFEPIAALIDEVKEATQQLEQNKAFWKGKDEEKVTYDQIFVGVA